MVIILFVTGCDNGNKPNYSDYDIADDSIMIYVNVKPETGEAECSFYSRKNKEVVFNDAVIKETLIVPSCPANFGAEPDLEQLLKGEV